MKQYVIIGNGVASVGCIEGIRSLDNSNKIIVVSEEKHAVYGRPLISYYLEGKTDLERMKYRSDDYYETMGCEVLYGKSVIKIDDENKTVLLDDNTVIPYDTVCVATGSRPFVPTFEGLDKVENKFSFMTLDDALALKKAISKKSNVLIVGAGLIGLKCAEGLKESVANITVCDLSNRVLSSILDDECASIMQAHLEANGIRFMLEDSVASFKKNKAVMQSGKEVDFDILVLAIGVRANTKLVSEIGGEVNKGIIVNNRMETTVKDVYSAGDCTEGEDISLGNKRVLAILPNAYMQGKCAGINMAGGNEMFDNAIPMNSIGFFGLHAMTAGSYFNENDGGEVYEEKTENTLKRMFTRNGLLTGYILIGNTDRAGIYTALIREKTPLNTIDFDMLKKSATFSAFSEESRRNKFGGVV